MRPEMLLHTKQTRPELHAASPLKAELHILRSEKSTGPICVKTRYQVGTVELVPHMCDVLVVARFRENTTWARAVAPEVLEYTKKIGNIGRESQSYLRFILEEHRSPRPNATRVCFSQGSVSGPQRSTYAAL